MSSSTLTAGALERALAIRDLTDPHQGPHAMQLLLEEIVASLASAWACRTVIERAHPIVSIADNYDCLHYPREGRARDERYTRYVSATHLLRTQTSAMIPPLLTRLHHNLPSIDILLVCPGLVYRRDTIDRLHTGEPHQVDLWRIRKGTPLAVADLEEMIARVAQAALPGLTHRSQPAIHPYTVAGRQIDVSESGSWVEIGECGLALPALLSECGLDAESWSGLAMGLGLDRLLMLRKGIDDIRLLRSRDPRIEEQLLDLDRYRPVSAMPAVRRDLSIAVAEDTTPEELGDRVRSALGMRASCIESVTVTAEAPYVLLPASALKRMGIAPGQKNVLLRVVLRDLSRTLTDQEANLIRDEIYRAVHAGGRHEWAASEGREIGDP
jgi:phenylalanyl-tRNA synthetase alpha chain